MFLSPKGCEKDFLEKKVDFFIEKIATFAT